MPSQPDEGDGVSANWGPCALGDYCVQPENPPGEWVQMVPTELGAQLHEECADTMYGAWLQLGHALRAFGRAIVAERRSLAAWIVVVWLLILVATIIGWWFA